MKNIIIFGANSAIALEVAKLYAVERANFYLYSRDLSVLEINNKDLLARGAGSSKVDSFLSSNLESHKQIIDKSFRDLGKVDIFLIAYGSLPNQELCEKDSLIALKELNTNGISVISLLIHAANRMESQGFGNITVITSVAGDKGRQSNYLYGSAKGMVSIFLQGLSHRFANTNIDILDIKPGLVDTPMTAEFTKGPLFSSPNQIALIIKNRISRKSSFSYTPFFWYFIIKTIKLTPKFIFNRMKI
ncbi:SDR family NAD(P)-dependent oxidoreductase [bacterium]|jgi:decaprenylphospho-beta-D-erythro-pentofuranosid-2-ulose 2-reductase|nr:SDR family NAD(P)-dependent oxidoreductase [bacterium]